MTTWVLFAGLPGTGKSTLAKALAARLHAAVLDKDRVRDALFPGTLTDYSAEQAQVCMKAMLQAAAYLTRHGRTEFIFFDGRTFSVAAHIDEVLRAAETAGAQWRILHLVCADEVAQERLRRPDYGHPAKNRDAALHQAIQQHWEPIVQPTLLIDTSSGGVATQLDAVEQYLREGVAGSLR